MRKISTTLSLVVLCSIVVNSAMAQKNAAMPHVLIYKAKAQYRKLVPVELSEDKQSVVSYPDPSDLRTGSSSLLPVLLHNGYWLDKRGISIHTAFIKLTYAEYAKLSAPPSAAELYGMIVDKDPIKELCDCGSRTEGKYSVKQLNALIDKKQLKKKCTPLK